MPEPPTTPRWLIVVRRDQLDLFRHLRESFDGVPEVAVILDRRHEERRQEAQPDGSPPEDPERRRRQRRRSVSVREQDLWVSAGFRLIHTAEDLKVYEADAPPPTP